MDYLVNNQIKALNTKVNSLPKTENAIRLDQGECAYPPSPRVIQAITESVTTINRYPEMLGGNLRLALADYTKTRKEQIIIGNGSDDLIELILKVFVDLAEQILLPMPTFPWYWYAAKTINREVVFVNRTDDFSVDINTLLEQITPKVKVIFIANPNNPTANLIERTTIIELIKQVNCLVVVDECYYEICQETVVDLIDTYPNLIVLRSFSKGFALAGLRVGYAIANEILIDYLYRGAQFFPVNTLAQVAAIAALNDLEYVRFQIDKMCEERKFLAQNLAQLGMLVYPSVTNFLFVSTQKLGIPASDLVKFLQSRNIYVRHCGLLPGLDDFYWRTSVGNSTENAALLNCLSEAITLKL
jgi:histidinol-phosphate aminotransferase